MKTIKILMTFVAFALLFVACNKEILNESIPNVLAKKGSDPAYIIKWYGESDKAVAVEHLVAEPNDTRKNASGPKITSNAHSADFPGIYFIWDAKQKDPGYLKVAAWLLELNPTFTITTKESSNYYDFLIQVQPGQQMTEDDCYVFFIHKNVKNINMVFIPEYTLPTPQDPCAGLEGEALCECLDIQLGLVPLFGDEYWAIVYQKEELGCDEPGVLAGVTIYYTACQLYNDIMWGADGWGLPAGPYSGGRYVPQGSPLWNEIHQTGLAHRDALQDWWGIPRGDQMVRYIPIGTDIDEATIEFYRYWGDRVLEAILPVLFEFGIFFDAYLDEYDVKGFLDRNGLDPNNLWRPDIL
jgi:hypothetical protein